MSSTRRLVARCVSPGWLLLPALHGGCLVGRDETRIDGREWDGVGAAAAPSPGDGPGSAGGSETVSAGSGGLEPLGGAASGVRADGADSVAPAVGVGADRARTEPQGRLDPPLSSAILACRQLDARATECGVLTSGSLCPAVPTDVDGCRAGCLRLAACRPLVDAVCERPPATESAPDGGPGAGAALASCLDFCAFICDDGVTIVPRWRCDGTPQCVDASDELGCPRRSFACGDDRLIPSAWVCDGQNDCAEAIDEDACDVTRSLACD